MAEIVLSAGELDRIEAIVGELKVIVDEFLGDARAALSGDEWAVVEEYATARVRRVLELGVSLHAVADAHEATSSAYEGRGRPSFVRAAAAAWAEAYASIPSPWRLALIYELIPGGEERLLADVATLETMAANRFFTSLDEQCAALLAAED